MKELNIRELQDRLDAIAIEEANEFDQIEDKKLELINKSRQEVTLPMVAPGLEDLLAEYQKDITRYNNERADVEAELKAQGMNDKEIENEISDGDYDFHYYDIEALEDKFNALDELLKDANADGNKIVGVMYSGPQDTSSREDFMREIKSTIKQNHPEVYDKLFMYDVGEAQTEEPELEEFKSLIGRTGGVMGFKN